MDHCRRGYADLGNAACARLEETEVVGLDTVCVAQPAGDRELRRCEVDFAVAAVELDGDTAVHGDTLELLEKVDVKVGAPELAVGDRLEADVFLQPRRVTNAGVFDFP